VSLALVGAGCRAADTGGAGARPAAGSIPPDQITFADVDRAMTTRLETDDLPGAASLVVRDGVVLQDATYGTTTHQTQVPIASASKWLTSALVMALVDEGRLDLDQPVARWLPEWGGAHQGVTLRLLLSHRAAVPGSAPCLGDPDSTLRACAAALAALPPNGPVGTAFHYGNAGYTVAAAVAEVAAGRDFATLFTERLARPLGLTATSFPSSPGGPPSPNPIPAAGAVSTLDDYGRFVAMMAAHGVTPDGTRVLSAAAVDEIERNQVAGIDTSGDFAVQITTFGTYGLGVWRDRSAPDGTTQMVSGSGSVGFYPWIDRERHAWGVLLVDDEAGGSGRAVRASTRIVHDLVLPAVDNARPS
jgi:CubicO group peptidase (beta-lactamase class C family)